MNTILFSVKLVFNSYYWRRALPGYCERGAIGFITVPEATLTGQKLQCFYGNQMTSHFFKN